MAIELTSENFGEGEVRSELDRILESPLFLQADRLGRFLRYTVESVLAGKGDSLKEYVIGTEVYDRKPPYSPSQDSIVRTEARRLRAKLKEYYEEAGKDDPVFIYFRPGTYVPVFRRSEASMESTPESGGEGLLIKGSGVPVAVLPFLDLSNRPLSLLCAQGVTDEVIHTLTMTDGIRVVANSAVTQSISGSYDIPSLSRKLGVLTILEGTVREDRDRLRITARVLSADGFQMSSHRFETQANADLLPQVQEQIATAFISRARPEISHIRKRKATPGALTWATYPLIMHAETLLDEGSPADLHLALMKFEEAAELAPSYARPHCGISHCHAEIALRGASPTAEPAARAKAAARRAIELDPGMIESYSCLGSAEALEWDWENAEKSFLRGMGLGDHVSSSRRYAMFLAAQGRFDEASHYLERAQRVDPFSNRQKVASAKFLYITRRHAEGVAELEASSIYGPMPVEVRFYAALMSASLGDGDRAKSLVESIRPDSGAQLSMMAGIAEVLLLSGESEAAKRIVSGFKLMSPDAGISGFRQALLALALGDGQLALSRLTEAVEHREAELVWIGVDPRFDMLRKEHVFEGLLHRVLPGFPY